jgi:hypothetical protein
MYRQSVGPSTPGNDAVVVLSLTFHARVGNDLQAVAGAVVLRLEAVGVLVILIEAVLLHQQQVRRD